MIDVTTSAVILIPNRSLVSKWPNLGALHGRRWKNRNCLRAGIPVFWIVNLIDRQANLYAADGLGEQPDYANCKIIAADGECLL